MQVKLLRAIQEKEIQRVGGDSPIKVDVRIIAATNRDLEQEVNAKNFREDLFYRLHAINIAVPPLRERIGDVPLLAQHFLDKYSTKNLKDLKGFTPTAMDALSRYPWPGNVRELENCMERAVILCMGQYISEKELLPAVMENYKSEIDYQPPGSTIGNSTIGKRSLDDVETITIKQTLAETRGNKSQAAKILNITRTTLNNKLKKYGLT